MSNDMVKRIGSIKFSCLSPEEIRKMSAVKVITADTYNDEGFPYEGGLMDTSLGVVEPGLKCKTCGCKSGECPGHFGHIELARPVIHVGFIKDIKSLLDSCCRNRDCGRLMLTAEQAEAARKEMERMDELGGDAIDAKAFSKETAKSASNRTVCPYCGAEHYKIKLDKPTSFSEETPEGNKKLTPQTIRERLERIPDEDLVTLGIDPKTCRPEWMILTALPVPPVTVRPTITLESGERSEDDLTHKLVDILRINQRLLENRDSGSPLLIVEDLWDLLQYHITTYFDNQTSGIPPARHRSGRPLKTLTQRLKGKEGRFRSNLSGKRVDFSARTVISPDPMLSINDVGVPIPAARELTVPVHVNASNIETIREMVRGGTEQWTEDGKYKPGVNYIIKSDERKMRVTANNTELLAENLEEGFTVERQLMDGDIVLFNRQPSLHRMSMMAHRVKVMEGKTFRFNLCVCPPYNADFDGDEMNLHVIQGEEARAEARVIMQVQENILSPRYGGPIIGAIHDHITGSFFLTNKNPVFDRQQAMNILTKLDSRDSDDSDLELCNDNMDYEAMIEADRKDYLKRGIRIPAPLVNEKGEKYWTGKQLFSTVLPRTLNCTFKSSVCVGCRDGCKKENCENDAFVKIRNGQLLCGTIDAKGVGNSKGKILDRIARDYGADCARMFINRVTRIALGAIMNHGFSTGIDDEDIPNEAKEQIKSFTDERVEAVNALIESYRDNTLEAMPGRSIEETLEMNIGKNLSEARDHAGEIVADHVGMANPAVIMAKAGARGSMLNLSQMAGCVGQQSVRGSRITRGYHMRTLPHFQKGDLGAYAKGFVENSYKSGLSPTEFFFHAMGGREGLVDTAVRTSRSGYMQRRLISALEDLKLMGDGSIRNTADTIIQFMYGEDGTDPARAVGGEAVNINDLFTEVLGDGADALLNLDKATKGEDYGSREKDEMEFSGDDDDDNDGDSDNDYESD